MLLIVGLAIGAALVLVFVAALVIHLMLLGSDRFNWLEAPKRSDLVSPVRVARSFCLREKGAREAWMR